MSWRWPPVPPPARPIAAWTDDELSRSLAVAEPGTPYANAVARERDRRRPPPRFAGGADTPSSPKDAPLWP